LQRHLFDLLIISRHVWKPQVPCKGLLRPGLALGVDYEYCTAGKSGLSQLYQLRIRSQKTIRSNGDLLHS
jgi:hypothetical protein